MWTSTLTSGTHGQNYMLCAIPGYELLSWWKEIWKAAICEMQFCTVHRKVSNQRRLGTECTTVEADIRVATHGPTIWKLASWNGRQWWSISVLSCIQMTKKIKLIEIIHKNTLIEYTTEKWETSSPPIVSP